MTIVLARKFDQRIIVLSDTMISDQEALGHNIFPGRLKSIVVNKWLTVSYAGLSVQAMDIIRSLRTISDLTTNDAVAILLRANEHHEDAIEFILCSHEEHSRLLKISASTASEGSDFYWIGSAEAATEISRSHAPGPAAAGRPDHVTQDELDFISTFWRFLNKGVSGCVGGAAVNCLCSPCGHCYQTHAGIFAWDTIVVGKDDPIAREAMNKTGMYQFGYNLCAPETRGVALVGLYFDQSATGYLYDPMNRDDAVKIRNTDVASFSRLVSDSAAVLAEGNL